MRYRIRYRGLDVLKKAKEKKGGVLFLPNHPAMIDPVVLSLKLWKGFHVRPVVVEYIYKIPFVHWILRFMKSLPMPNFEVSTNSFKVNRGEKSMQKIVSELNKGENFLLYPAGRLRSSPKETIGGASGAHTILQNVDSCNVILIRTTGLWGSRFSRAITGKMPSFAKQTWESIKLMLRNLIFFSPRREIVVEFSTPPEYFPYRGSRIELNRTLEEWYNSPFGKGGEPISLVPSNFWSKKTPKVKRIRTKRIHLGSVPKDVQKSILREVARVAKVPEFKIDNKMELSSDLGLDSIDIATLATFVAHNYDAENLAPDDLFSVESVMIAAVEHKEAPAEKMKGNINDWFSDSPRPEPFAANGDTIQEAFLHVCDYMGSSIACADNTSGIFSYKKLKMAALLLSKQVRKLPGDKIGILLPSTVAAYIVVLAVLLAKKVPVMFNWTIGPKQLRAVKKSSSTKVILSSWKFLERLPNVDFGGLEDAIVLLEDIREEIGIWDKLWAIWLSNCSKEKVISKLNLQRVNEKAVLLFTSGTEGPPKGVPLTHKNVLSNQRAAFEAIDFSSKDVLQGILPPFHAFGFTITGLLPLLSGIKVAYFPNPTNSEALSREIAKWRVTLVCGTPVFVQGIFNKGLAKLKTVRLFIVGAEKAPMSLFEKVKKLKGGKRLAEGYGVTEGSPVLTLNLSGDYRNGVGKPLNGVEIKIVHPENHTELPLGDIGLVIAFGPNIFKGYLSKRKKSPFVTLDNRNWYITGDLGFIDGDGNLILSGRLKRFVKVGGEMVGLPIIEEVLVNKFVSQDKVFKSGHKIAVVAKEVEGEKTEIYLFTTLDITREEVNSALRADGFSALSKVSGVKKMSKLPLSGSGKTDYRGLERLL